METYYTIYKITNTINNMIYVGRHKTNNLDDGYMGSGIRIKAAIRKYGSENFTKEILMECTDMEELCDIEEILVDESFIARRDTYNLGCGGKGGVEEHTLSTLEKISATSKGRPCPMKGKKHSPESIAKMVTSSTGFRHSEESKAKMSANNKGRKGTPHSNETRVKLSAAMKGRSPWNKGKTASEESKRRMSESHMGQTPWNKGIPTSEEQKAKQSAAMKLVMEKKKQEQQKQHDDENIAWYK